MELMCIQPWRTPYKSAPRSKYELYFSLKYETFPEIFKGNQGNNHDEN
jgi:hypothetical protein